MLLRTTGCRPKRGCEAPAAASPARPTTKLAIVRAIGILAIGGLVACSPVDSWRSITGADRNDPDPQTTANTRNMAAGEQAPYPNLGSVPPPPIPTMTAAERDKLTKSLVADQANAKYNEEKLLPGFSTNASVPPPRPAPAPAAAAGGTADRPSASAPAPALGVPGTAPVPAAPSTALGAPPATAIRPGEQAPAARKPGEPPEPGPMESNLQMPQPRSTPEPDAARPPPAPPRVTMAPTPPPPAGEMAPAAVAAATPPAPPPAPVIAPPPASPAPTPARIEARRPEPMTVLALEFSGTATTLDSGARDRLAKVAALYREQPGMVHVVSHAAATPAGRDQLDNYRAALTRGQAVAKVLAEAGIPANKIVTEAAPTRGDAASGRIEVQFSP